jgi:transcriptional regulator with XRE-family HTH domain
MPERSFGRSVRYRRTKLGLSQAQLGELVGRSASSIRSWERDVSTPTDPSVILALGAILDLDDHTMFEKAGVEMPPVETRPTVEEALASLAPVPLPMDDSPSEFDQEVDLAQPIASSDTAEVVPRPDSFVVVEPVPGPVEDDPELPLDSDSELEAEFQEHLEEAAEPKLAPASDREPDDMFEPFSLRSDPVGVSAMRSTSEPAFISPPDPYLMTAPVPPVVEPSYMEDSEQRQLYRVRNVATIVLFVGLVIVLLWSLSNTLEALGEWWEGFFGSLRL